MFTELARKKAAKYWEKSFEHPLSNHRQEVISTGDFPLLFIARSLLS